MQATMGKVVGSLSNLHNSLDLAIYLLQENIISEATESTSVASYVDLFMYSR